MGEARSMSDEKTRRKPRASRKPRLTPRECRWFDRVHRAVVEDDLRGESLVQAFSDVHDSGLTLAEVRPLVRQRLLRVVHMGVDDLPRVDGVPYEPTGWCRMPDGRMDHSPLIGFRKTVDLTERALRLFWPDRIQAPATLERGEQAAPPRPREHVPLFADHLEATRRHNEWAARQPPLPMPAIILRRGSDDPRDARVDRWETGPSGGRHTASPGPAGMFWPPAAGHALGAGGERCGSPRDWADADDDSGRDGCPGVDSPPNDATDAACGTSGED